MKKWLPTALLISSILVLAGFFVAMRLLLGPVFANQAEVLTPPSAPPVEQAIAPAAPPVAAVPVVVAASVAASDPASRASTTPGIRFVARAVEPTYVVVAGDNLWSIAQRHNTTSEALQAFNNLERPSLSIGQRLVIP